MPDDHVALPTMEMLHTENRICRVCGQSKPLSEEHFGKSKAHIGGLNTRCRACSNDYIKRFRDHKKAGGEGKFSPLCSVCGSMKHYAVFHDQTKTCKSCGETKPITEFDAKQFANRNRKYPHHDCRQCELGRQRVERRNNLRRRLASQLSQAKGRAKKRGQECDLDLEHLLALHQQQEGRCYYTGRPLTLDLGDQGISLDRKDSSIGYTKENVVLTVWLINRIKSNVDHDSFLEICRQVVDLHPSATATS